MRLVSGACWGLFDGNIFVPIVTSQQPGGPCMFTPKEYNDSPKLWLLSNELLHQLLALSVIQDHQLFPPSTKMVLPTHKVLILANDHTLYFVEYARTRAHVTWRQGGIHGGTLVGGGRQTARVFQGRNLSLNGGNKPPHKREDIKGPGDCY